MTSGADALIVDLEDSIALEGKAARAAQRGGLPERGHGRPSASRPYMMVRVNGLQTGLTDADLDAIAPAKPDAIMLPKAEGGASVIHADAKLAVREAHERACPTAISRSCRSRPKPRQRCFSPALSPDRARA